MATAVGRDAFSVPQQKITYGPWLGSMRSVTRDRVPREFIAGGSEFLYLPRTHSWKRRGGQAIKFDSFSAPVGLLPAKWTSKGRWLEEFTSESITDSVPTLLALATKETVASGLDDGRFSNLYLRDQVGNAHYTLGSEYDTTYGSALGTIYTHKLTPLWHDSGDGTVTRGTTEFARRFWVSGSRRFLKVGNWTYHPSLLGTPSRWRGQTAAGVYSNRLMPSGPISPTHAGTLTKGTLTSTGLSEIIYPTSDVTVGTWAAAPLFSKVDDTTISDVDNIQAVGNASYCELGLATPATIPTSGDTVVLVVRLYRSDTSTGTLDCTVRAGAGSTLCASKSFGFAGAGLWQTVSYTLTAAEIAAVTAANSSWNNVRIRMDPNMANGVVVVHVSYAVLTVTPGVTLSGGWKGSDRFYFSVGYRFEDGSVWMPCPPRAPNANLPDGFDLFTVDSNNPTATFDKVTWGYVPIGPFGTIGRVLYRTLKIDSTISDNLQLNIDDLRVVWEIQDNTTTTYDDYFADDATLLPAEVTGSPRPDLIMPPRARYVFGGDMRVCHAYAAPNPAAIQLAIVGTAADYDRNVADDSATAYASKGAYARLALSSAGVMTLNFGTSDATTYASTSYTSADYATLQALVDKINASSFATLTYQFRAQLCPGASPDAAMTSLTPHTRDIASCVVSGQTITKAAGGLSKVGVGAMISGTGVTVGAYISRIDSDTQLTFVGTITPATITATFFFALGDKTTSAGADAGYQRLIANSLPGFFYFTKTYLGTALDKQAVYMTIAPPGQAKSAANCFSGLASNVFRPPTGNAGIVMGGAGVDQGFVVPYANKLCVIRNDRDSGTGEDADYRMHVLNESRGCCAWNTVIPGNRFVPFLSPEGIIAADLHSERSHASDAIWLHQTSDAKTGVGDFSYEVPQSIAATAADNDLSYASARIMRGVLWVNYRSSSQPTRPDSQVAYDFSSSSESGGLDSFFRPDGMPWGWSVPLTRALTAMCEGRRSDGAHLYGWNDANAGSTGDGRIDEFETTDQDNGSSIGGSVSTPYERLGRMTLISAQEITVEHSSPVTLLGIVLAQRIQTAVDALYAGSAFSGYGFEIVAGFNDVFRYSVVSAGGNPYSFTITAGSYTGDTLAAVVQTGMNTGTASHGKTFTATYSAATKKFTITASSGTWNLARTTYTTAANIVLGFQMGIAGSNLLTQVSELQRAVNRIFITVSGVNVTYEWSNPLTTCGTLLGYAAVDDGVGADAFADSDTTTFALDSSNNTLIFNNSISDQTAVIALDDDLDGAVFLDFHRVGDTDTTYTLSPEGSGSAVVDRDVKMLPQAARVAIPRCYIGWRQTAGAASEIRSIELRVKSLPSYK